MNWKAEREAAIEKFSDSGYLKHGNERQRALWDFLDNSKILEKLSPWQPLIAGTIPIGIDTHSSDLDILCCFGNQEFFLSELSRFFSREDGFSVKECEKDGIPSVVMRFQAKPFPVEIFGQTILPLKQTAFVHMVNEYLILKKRGEEFRREVVGLKEKGIKTEPAFAQLLGLEGDPYRLLADDDIVERC